MSDAKLTVGAEPVPVETKPVTIEELKGKADEELPALIAYDVTKTDRASQLRLREAVVIMERIGVGGDKPTLLQRVVRFILERAHTRQAEKV